MADDTDKAPGFAQVLLAGVVSCIVFAVMQGVHDNYGIMLNPLVERTGNSYAHVSFVIGVGAFLYGLLPPFFGMAALKRSNAFVMLCGIFMMAAGLVLTPLCKPFPLLLVVFGLLLPAGTAALGFAIIMGAVTPIMGERKAAAFSGILQASAGIGDALMSPALQSLISSRGISFALATFSVVILAMSPAIVWLGHRNARARQGLPGHEEARHGSVWTIFRDGMKSPAYRHVFIAFSTCGFNMSIIESHLFSQFVAGGIEQTRSSFIMAIYGVFTMLGAMLTGFLCLRLKMKNVLGATYGLRVLISVAFLVCGQSISLPFAIVTTALLGMCGDATVPPTSGIITESFGSDKMPILYGCALFAHQVGAFASASLGGLFVSRGLGYAPLWAVNLVLATIASAASFSVRSGSSR